MPEQDVFGRKSKMYLCSSLIHGPFLGAPDSLEIPGVVSKRELKEDPP